MESFDYAKNLQYILDNCDKIDLIHRLKILKDVANGLRFCHKNFIIHRDLKPDNLMIVLNNSRSDYVCKLFDFGCSYKFQGADDILNGCKNEHYYDGNMSVVGTIRYSAPELLQGTQPTPSIDVYSYGVLMWQLKENQIPYECIKSNEIIIWQVVRNNLRPDSSLYNHRESRKDNSNKVLKPRILLSLSYTPNKLLNVSNKKLSSKSDFKLEKYSRTANLKNYTRKSLFVDEMNDEDEVVNIFIDLLTDHHLYLRNGDDLLSIESEYEKLYKACWHEQQTLRPDVTKICDLFEKFIKFISVKI